MFFEIHKLAYKTSRFYIYCFFSRPLLHTIVLYIVPIILLSSNSFAKKVYKVPFFCFNFF